MQVTGGCFCGVVRVAAEGQPKRVGICHCLDCRKHQGALFYAAAVFDAGAVTVTGEVSDYQGRCFCPRCGSTVFGRTGGEIEVTLGTLDKPDVFVPEYELWCERREGWLPDFPGTERFERARS